MRLYTNPTGVEMYVSGCAVCPHLAERTRLGRKFTICTAKGNAGAIIDERNLRGGFLVSCPLEVVE